MKIVNRQKTAEKIAQMLKLTGEIILPTHSTDLSPFWVGKTLVVIDNDKTTAGERSAVALAKKLKANAIAVQLNSAQDSVINQTVLDLDNFDDKGNESHATFPDTEEDDEETEESDYQSRYGASRHVFASGRCGGVGGSDTSGSVRC